MAPHPGTVWERQEGAGGGTGQEWEGRADVRSLTLAAASLTRGDKYWAVATRCAGWNHKGFPSR